MYAVTLSLAVSSSGEYSLTKKKKSQRNITIRWIESSSQKKNQKLRPLLELKYLQDMDISLAQALC